MALYILSADPAAAKQEGNTFNCLDCKKMKTHEDRKKKMKCMDGWDARENNTIVIKGYENHPFPFCPGKVFRDDPETVEMYKILIVCLETNTLPDYGAVNNQDPLWIDLISEFSQIKKNFERVKFLEGLALLIGGDA